MLDISEFLPIKLTPGFISVAFHLGCIGCNFCSVRYGNSRDQIFKAGIQRKYSTSPSDILELLNTMPSFSKARVPLRIGNDTDLRFELDQVAEFVSLLPTNYPAALLTRFPIKAADAQRIGRESVIVKLTATPYSPSLDCPDNSTDVVASARHFDTPVVVAVGPITADNFATSLDLIQLVPRKANVSIYLKPLNDEFHPSLKEIEQITTEQYVKLCHAVASTGTRHLSQLMCPVNDILGIHHKRVSDVPPDERTHCATCSSHLRCYSDEPFPEQEALAELTRLGIAQTGRPSQVAYKSWVIPVDVPTAYGDEAYLSEIFGLKIKLSGTALGTGSSAFAASLAVLERWNGAGFFPYAKLLDLSKQVIEEAFYAARHRLQPIYPLGGN